MTDTFLPPLPLPALKRWQPLRLGLIELFHYDSEEFWFRDGRLLLRGNNGTGKSKALSLTLPFLFDAQLKSSRIEPDGDAGKKMAWNLLLGQHDRRMGYTWLEFGRLDADGQPHYLTLGCGLLAAAARAQVDSWFFLLEQQRIGQDLWLMNPARVVLTRDRLRDALQSRGQVFETAAAYRRAVDERLFHLGPARYAALMDTLIQLRQPQLSKKPDETNLSNALTEALPPISTDLLADVADALNQLEEYRRELEEYEALEQAVQQFNQRYRHYAATKARRSARGLRGAQTGFDNASRELNENRAALLATQATEAQAHAAQQQAETAQINHRTRLDTLRNDPAMADAKTLATAAEDAAQRQREAADAHTAHQRFQTHFDREQQATHRRAQHADETGRLLAARREQAGEAAALAGLSPAYDASALAQGQASALAPAELESARQHLHRTATARREQVEHLQRRCQEAEQAAQSHAQAQGLRDERMDETEAAAARREAADAAVEQQGQHLLETWQRHLDSLQQLQLPDHGATLGALAAWTADLHGDNPARAALHHAQQAASLRLAQRQTEQQTEQQSLKQEQMRLLDERARLQLGADTHPSPPVWRAPDSRDSRPGAPLWQLVDFNPAMPADACADLEAALQASGLLDAWITPDGAMQDRDGTPLPHDTQWIGRPSRPDSLAAWLQPAVTDTALPVPPAVLRRLLEGVAYGDQDNLTADTWIGPNGRFRLGTLAGAWHKPLAEYIGYAARAAARARRLTEIAQRLGDLDQALSRTQAKLSQLEADQRQAASEWQSAPADDALRAAHLQASAHTRELDTARLRLEQAEDSLRHATRHWETAKQTLEQDARDLSLPASRNALRASDQALLAFGELLYPLANAARAHHDALAEHVQQQERQRDAQSNSDHAAEQAAERGFLADQARIRLQTLRESLGAKVDELERRIQTARQAVTDAEAALKQANETLRSAGEARARAEQKREAADAILAERSAARQQAIEQWQGFAATGLLDIALPGAEQPPQDTPWTIDPALALARRAEQALHQIDDDEPAWNRVQNQVSQDYTELGRALAALNQRAQAETSDFGLIVSIIYQNRPERPDQLSARLADEIAQRRELLTAGERQVLENHLQAEIASAIHKLLHDAEQQVRSINEELHKRQTSTGVRFRLQWETLPEGTDDGAPVGLKAARHRLLHTSTDLWSAEDRRVVGEMLQQRIAAERSRADADQGGSLHEQLARALDYRRWHRFRVQRWDGQWRPLAGPASSGERALGLTVPLFAAVSSYYSQTGHTQAPRLVLLDEVFAGIDDAARQHCWALIREFDLDFVVTSEREWACSAELPGVAIAQLQRHEGIDAVHVSRWTWDGHAKRQVPDPDRRFPPAA